MKSAAAIAPPRAESLASDLAELMKLRLSSLVLVTTLVGFLLGWRGPMDFMILAATLVGTGLCAAGAGALNQWWERDHDALMKRTRQRPLPAGRLHASDALLLGTACAAGGVILLAGFVNFRSAFLAFATVAIYLFAYTPMKRVSTLNTLVGAIPGALPPLIGWVAARGHYSLEGCLLFAILWFWQMPHFLAIAWMYREDYAQAGFVMLSGGDDSGFTTSRQAVLYTVCLTVVSLAPAVLGFASPVYFYGALVLGAVFSWTALRFLTHRDRPAARRLFFASILYLPVLLGLLVFCQR